MSLQSALDRAVESNYNIRIQRLAPAITKEQTSIQEAAFEVETTLQFNHNERKSPTAGNALDGATRLQTETRDYRATTSKELAHTGTELSLNGRLTRSSTNSSNALINPNVTSELGINITQPLLRNNWSVNLLPLLRAQKQYQSELYLLKENILDTLFDTEAAYWRLVAAQQRLKHRQSGLALARNLLEETRERLRLGLATNVDILQAESEVTAREQDIEAEKNRVADAEDTLAYRMGKRMPHNENSHEVAQLQLDKLPTTPAEPNAFTYSLSQALESDFAQKRQSIQVEIRRIEKRLAKNRLMPDLDLKLGGAHLGRGNAPITSVDRATERDAWRWNTGLEVSIPWTFKEERAKYRLAKRQLKRAEIQLEQLQEQLVRDLRGAWRDAHTQIKQVVSASKRLDFNRASHDQERARYSEGLASFRNTLEALRELDQSRINLVNRQLDALIAQSRLARLEGSLLKNNQFDWEAL